jgi:esterase
MLLHSISLGDSEKTIIILHGLMGSSGNWRTVQETLSETHRVICLDLPNHGRSPHAAMFTLQSLAQDVSETMDALGAPQAVIIGHSLGGKVAMRMCSGEPVARQTARSAAATTGAGRVRGLVVVDMTPRAFQPMHLFTLRACQQLDLRRGRSRGALDPALAQSIPLKETRDSLLQNVVRQADGSFAWRMPLHYLIDNYRVVSDAVHLTEPYRGPTLFVAGEGSPFRVERDAEMMGGWFPAMRLVTIPGGGHLVHTDQPDAFIRTVRQFLEEEGL